MWGIEAGEPHRSSLAPGDLVVIYLSSPDREFVACAEVASPVHEWAPPELQRYPGHEAGGVALSQVDEWEPPVPVDAVLARIDPAENARSDFAAGVVRITEHEYSTVVALGAQQPL